MLRLHQDRPPPAAAAAAPADQGKAVVARDVLGGHDGPHVPRRVGDQLMVEEVPVVPVVVRGGGRGRAPRSGQSARIRVGPTA